jgi:hypothetical protein
MKRKKLTPEQKQARDAELVRRHRITSQLPTLEESLADQQMAERHRASISVTGNNLDQLDFERSQA